MDRRITRKAIVTAATIIVATAGGASGQKANCGPVSPSTHDLERVVEVFADPDSFYVQFRAEKGIAPLPPRAPRRIVTDARTCDRILGAARTVLRRLYADEDQFKDFTFAFYRVGEYYVALQIPDMPKDVIVSGYVDLLIFRVADLSFVAHMLS